MNKVLPKLPLWFFAVCTIYTAGLLTYAALAGRQVSVFPPSIGPEVKKTESPDAGNVELWTVNGVLQLQAYRDLSPAILNHRNDLVLRVDPPRYDVRPDGSFTVENIPVKVDAKNNREVWYFMVYPIEKILSLGYQPEMVPISSNPPKFGSKSNYSITFDVGTKTATITTPVVIRNPSRESRAPSYSMQATVNP
jgi:hypothetical protein